MWKQRVSTCDFLYRPLPLPVTTAVKRAGMFLGKHGAGRTQPGCLYMDALLLLPASLTLPPHLPSLRTARHDSSRHRRFLRAPYHLPPLPSTKLHACLERRAPTNTAKKRAHTRGCAPGRKALFYHTAHCATRQHPACTRHAARSGWTW